MNRLQSLPSAAAFPQDGKAVLADLTRETKASRTLPVVQAGMFTASVFTKQSRLRQGGSFVTIGTKKEVNGHETDKRYKKCGNRDITGVGSFFDV